MEAQESLGIADQAIVDSQTELAKRVAARALAAARKWESDDLVKQATLLLSERMQPVTEEVKERARQRLREGGPFAACGCGREMTKKIDDKKMLRGNGEFVPSFCHQFFCHSERNQDARAHTSQLQGDQPCNSAAMISSSQSC